MSESYRERLAFLVRVVGKELHGLQQTDQRLFAEPVDVDRLAHIADDQELAERIEAFVARFARLQDTLGDKLLPALLSASGERPQTAIKNLDRAEKLGWLPSADRWLALRKLRNRMVHEYVEDLNVLADALNQGHAAIPLLEAVLAALTTEAATLLDAQ